MSGAEGRAVEVVELNIPIADTGDYDECIVVRTLDKKKTFVQMWNASAEDERAAHLFAAAYNAALDLPEYDPVELMKAIPKIINLLRCEIDTFGEQEPHNEQ